MGLLAWMGGCSFKRRKADTINLLLMVHEKVWVIYEPMSALMLIAAPVSASEHPDHLVDMPRMDPLAILEFLKAREVSDIDANSVVATCCMPGITPMFVALGTELVGIEDGLSRTLAVVEAVKKISTANPDRSHLSDAFDRLCAFIKSVEYVSLEA